MPRSTRQKIPLVSENDMERAVKKTREITGLSAYNTKRQLFLKFAFRTGDIATVYLDPIQAAYLLQYLRRILPTYEETQGSPVKWEVEGVEASYGTWFPKS